jgi:hypothetical protein
MPAEHVTVLASAVLLTVSAALVKGVPPIVPAAVPVKV